MSIFLMNGASDGYLSDLEWTVATSLTDEQRRALRGSLTGVEGDTDIVEPEQSVDLSAHPTLAEVLSSDGLTFWAVSTSYDSVYEEMTPGDYVLFTVGKDRQIRYAQRVDVVLDDVPASSREAMTRNLKDSDRFVNGWLSSTPVTEVDVDYERLAAAVEQTDAPREKVETLGASGYFTKIPDSAVDAHGGPESFVEAITGAEPNDEDDEKGGGKLTGGTAGGSAHLTELQYAAETPREAETYRTAVAHLVAGRNVVFHGPPGTGKTRAARRVTEMVCGPDNYRIATANSEWTNYDVVGGYAPAGGGSTEDEPESGARDQNWRSKPGYLAQAARDCHESLLETERPAWLIVDELNRANLDQAFGQVFTLLDMDYRDRPLDYGDERIHVPHSFRIVATMNTYDLAQLFSLGYAFRRRFAFVGVSSLLGSATGGPTEVDRDRLPSIDPTRAVGDIDDRVRSIVVEEALTDLLRTGSAVDGDDYAAVFSAFADEERLRERLAELRADDDLGHAGLDFVDVLVGFGDYVTEQGVVEIGHALAMDAVRFVLAYALVFPEQMDATVVDQAVESYYVPQFEHAMSDLRRAETVESGSDASERYDRVVALAAELGFEETAAALREASEDKQVL